MLERVSSLDDFWSKLSRARGSFCQKIRAVRTGAWPRALHGVSAVVVGKKHWPVIRTSYMKALKILKPGSNAFLQMMLDMTDPQCYAIWTSLLDFRALGRHDSQLALLDLIGAQAVDAAQASVSQVLCHRVHQLGWTVQTGGFVCDRYGSFSLLDCCVHELHRRVSWSWLDFVATQVDSRQDFKQFNRADVVATRKGTLRFSLFDRASLRAVLNGTLFTNRHSYKWSQNGSLQCPACGQTDSLRHKYWECPWTLDLVASVPHDVVALLPDLPDWARDRGWTICPSVLDAWRSYLIGLPLDLTCCPSVGVPEGVLDLFTDGSCIPGITSDLNVAAWAVCVGSVGCTGSTSETFRVLSSGPLVGLSQSAYRAELFALYAAVCIASRTEFSCRIWSDCAGVISKYRRLTTGHQCLNVNSRHVDLWRAILQKVEEVGAHRVCLAKVSAHVCTSTLDNEVEMWLARGNAAADAAAQGANRDRSPAAWALWTAATEEVIRANHVGDVIRAHIVEVNKRWYKWQRGSDSPAVHVTRVAQSGPTIWECEGRCNSAVGKVARFLGTEFADRFKRWWNDIVNFDLDHGQWVSYIELYLDWQLVEKHAGVLKVQGRWQELHDAAMVPEQWTFRVRCKYFRLLLQQFARDIGVKFSTQTSRPGSPAIQCHVGMAFIPVHRSRLACVEEWLRRKVSHHIVAPEHLDNIPPAW